jgi:hypothetical protein
MIQNYKNFCKSNKLEIIEKDQEILRNLYARKGDI